jgi:hypothetical protein
MWRVARASLVASRPKIRLMALGASGLLAVVVEDKYRSPSCLRSASMMRRKG